MKWSIFENFNNCSTQSEGLARLIQFGLPVGHIFWFGGSWLKDLAGE